MNLEGFKIRRGENAFNLITGSNETHSQKSEETRDIGAFLGAFPLSSRRVKQKSDRLVIRTW